MLRYSTRCFTAVSLPTDGGSVMTCRRDAGYPGSARAGGHLLSGHQRALATMPAWTRFHAPAASKTIQGNDSLPDMRAR